MLSQPINHRRFQHWMASTTQQVGTVIVGQKEDDVGPFTGKRTALQGPESGPEGNQ